MNRISRVGLLSYVIACGCGSAKEGPVRAEYVVGLCREVSDDYAESLSAYRAFPTRRLCDHSTDPLCEKQMAAEPGMAAMAKETLHLGLPLGWADRKAVQSFLAADLHFCVDVVRSQAKKAELHDRINAASTKFVAATPTDVGPAVETLVGLSSEIRTATASIKNETVDAKAIKVRCDGLAKALKDAVPAYQAFAKDSPCASIDSPLCRTSVSESDYARELTMRSALPLGWEDRVDLVHRLHRELSFCAVITRATERAPNDLLHRISKAVGAYSAPRSPMEIVHAVEGLSEIAEEIAGYVNDAI